MQNRFKFRMSFIANVSSYVYCTTRVKLKMESSWGMFLGSIYYQNSYKVQLIFKILWKNKLKEKPNKLLCSILEIRSVVLRNYRNFGIWVKMNLKLKGKKKWFRRHRNLWICGVETHTVRCLSAKLMILVCSYLPLSCIKGTLCLSTIIINTLNRTASNKHIEILEELLELILVVDAINCDSIVGWQCRCLVESSISRNDVFTNPKITIWIVIYG